MVDPPVLSFEHKVCMLFQIKQEPQGNNLFPREITYFPGELISLGFLLDFLYAAKVWRWLAIGRKDEVVRSP